MAFMVSKDKKDFTLDCECGCCEGIRFRFDSEDEDIYLNLSIVSGDFYNKQKNKRFYLLKEKLKRIWFVIRNKDYHYFDIILSKNDFEDFKSFINDLK